MNDIINNLPLKNKLIKDGFDPDLLTDPYPESILDEDQLNKFGKIFSKYIDKIYCNNINKIDFSECDDYETYALEYMRTVIGYNLSSEPVPTTNNGKI